MYFVVTKCEAHCEFSVFKTHENSNAAIVFLHSIKIQGWQGTAVTSDMRTKYSPIIPRMKENIILLMQKLL